jgi:hypothetical protein
MAEYQHILLPVLLPEHKGNSVEAVKGIATSACRRFSRIQADRGKTDRKTRK